MKIPVQFIPLSLFFSPQIGANGCDDLRATFVCESVTRSHAHWSYGKPSGGIRADMIRRVRFKRDKQDCEVPRVYPWLATETSGHRLQHKHNNKLPPARACVTFCENDCQHVNREGQKRQSKSLTDREKEENVGISPVPVENPGRLKLYCFTSSYQRSDTSLPVWVSKRIKKKCKIHIMNLKDTAHEATNPSIEHVCRKSLLFESHWPVLRYLCSDSLDLKWGRNWSQLFSSAAGLWDSRTTLHFLVQLWSQRTSKVFV